MKVCQFDGSPETGSESSTHLGARLGTDVRCDDSGYVLIEGAGMSVAPKWQQLPFTRIPKRLNNRVPGAAGSNKTACYAMGSGAFVRSCIARSLELIPDSPSHGVIAPTERMTFIEYNQALADTRICWEVDES
jgi:hypothetical protein